jgi:polyisoprenyl-teichoic acid--peptidoglycan teichoic acid transferase
MVSMIKVSARKRGFPWLMIVLILVVSPLVGHKTYLMGFLAADNVGDLLFTPWDKRRAESFVARTRSTPAHDSLENTFPVTPTPSVIMPEPEQWDGASRVNILFMGLDYRDWEEGEGPPRSDTMILFTIDPLNNTAGLVSIPRDLWVYIPTIGYNKINTAYRFGEHYNLPGGGPGLAMHTVEGLLGVTINYYVQLDFFAFEMFINEIGGVEIDVPGEISIDPLGPNNKVILQPGIQKLDGPLALAYARARNTEGGDIDRAERQQQVIFAIRDRILSLNMLPTLVSKAPVLYQHLGDGIHTNMSIDQIIQLAWLGNQIKSQNIKHAVIGNQHVMFITSPTGLSALKPIMSRVRSLRDEIFVGDVLSKVAQRSSLTDLVELEESRISITNKTRSETLLEMTSNFLEARGVVILEATQSSETSMVTQIIDYTGNPYTVKYLVELMDIKPRNIKIEFNPDSEVDIILIIGADWQMNNTLP